jgi:lysophospholipase L1-like esterase
VSAELERLAALLARLGPGRHATLCALGDSNTANALFTRGGKQWPELMHQEMRERYATQDLTLINAGISGDSVREARARLERDVLRHRPDLVVACLGANDAGRLDDAEFSAGMNEILDRVRASGAAVVLRTGAPIVEKEPPPKHLWTGDHQHRAKYDLVRAIARERGIALVDTWEQFWRRERASELDCASLYCDEVHLGAEGHVLVWRGLAPYLGCPRELAWERRWPQSGA